MARILLINIQQFGTNLTVGYVGTESITSLTDDRKIQQYIMYTNKISLKHTATYFYVFVCLGTHPHQNITCILKDLEITKYIFI